jgi:hypothetical protein
MIGDTGSDGTAANDKSFDMGFHGTPLVVFRMYNLAKKPRRVKVPPTEINPKPTGKSETRRQTVSFANFPSSLFKYSRLMQTRGAVGDEI